ncbi:MAG: hypothetical protein IJG45_00940 [Oscillospiraceae bacterium]|nr:hypothetical protein [Oscillospiraceae bacterium]
MQRTRHFTGTDKQFLELYTEASPEAQKIIFQMIVLTVAHGDAFLTEARTEAARGGKEALIAVIKKWTAITDASRIIPQQA